MDQRRLSACDALATAAVLVGLTGLAGWVLDVPGLKSILPGLTTMKANTAIGFTAAGASVLLLPRCATPRVTPRHWASGVFGALAFLLGGLTLVEYVGGLSLGLDQLLFTDAHTTSPPYPGRMAPGTAVGLACAGAALLLLGYGLRRGSPACQPYVRTAHALAVAAGAIGYLSLAGYTYDVHGLHTLGPYASVALSTAIAFLLLSGALLGTAPDEGWRRAFTATPLAYAVLRWQLPLSLLLPFAAGGLVVWGARTGMYEPLYASALFALACSVSAVGLAWSGAGGVRRAELRMGLLARALHASEERLRIAQAAGHVGTFEWYPATGRLEVSDTYRKIWGLDPGLAVTTTRLLGLVVPEDRALAGPDRLDSHGNPLGYVEFRITHGHTGAPRWLARRGEVIEPAYATEATSRFVGAVTDITDQVAARETLARSHRELEHLVAARTAELQAAQAQLAHAQRMEALGQLAGGIAHDFNNVMQAVLGAAALIESRADDSARVMRLAQMIHEAAGRGAAVTRRLLTFGRRTELRAEPVDIAALLTGMQEILTHTIGAGISVRLDLGAPLPLVQLDRAQLETVLVNLATNARDAMAGIGTLIFTARIETALRRVDTGGPAGLKPGLYLCLSVTDTGAGMAADVLARASEPFFTTKASGHGTGLGLAMARGFAEQSGGALVLESTMGQGTTVKLWFPLAGTPALAAPPRPAIGAGMPAHRRRLLMVDDDALVRDTMAQQMQASGYEVSAMPDAAQALAALRADPSIDLLVTDFSMPRTDGLALIRAAQKLRPGLPAILVTGHATNGPDAPAITAMSATYTLLRKPIEARSLAARVEALLGAVAA